MPGKRALSSEMKVPKNRQK